MGRRALEHDNQQSLHLFRDRWLGSNWIPAAEGEEMSATERKREPRELALLLHVPCAYCSKPFTSYEVRTGEPTRNEHGHLMHMECYNRWCDEHPHPSIVIDIGAENGALTKKLETDF